MIRGQISSVVEKTVPNWASSMPSEWLSSNTPAQKFSQSFCSFDDHSAENCVRRPFALLLLPQKKLMKIPLWYIITHCAPYGIKMRPYCRWVIFRSKLMHLELPHYSSLWDERSASNPRCLKIRDKVSFNIASEASFVYILRRQEVH